jgi:hypothetical protein
MAQVVQHLLSKHKGLSSSPVTMHTKNCITHNPLLFWGLGCTNFMYQQIQEFKEVNISEIVSVTTFEYKTGVIRVFQMFSSISLV